MRIPVSYTYRNFPFSKKATRMSQQLGILTNWAACMVDGLFWCMAVDGLLCAVGFDGDAGMVLSLVSLVGLAALIRAIKRSVNAKINEAALSDLIALRETDPEAFMRSAAQMA